MGTHRVFEDGTEADAVGHFVRAGWVHVRPADGDAWARPAGVGRRGGRVARWRRVAAPPRADRRRAGAVPHREPRAAPRRACGRCCARGRWSTAAGALLGEPAVLYKDKLNYKLPGGAGYAAHQDAPAYRFVEVHVSCMVAVDDAGQANGCLEVVSGAHDRLWPTDDAGCIRADVVDAMEWEPVPVRAGDTLWFHSRTPHRSGPNSRPGPGGRCTRRTTLARKATCGRTTTGRRRPSWRPRRPPAIGWRCRSSATSRGGRCGDCPSTRCSTSIERWGAERYDEEVGQLDHALQTAALAAAAGAADALVAAALLHDVGHLLRCGRRTAGAPRVHGARVPGRTVPGCGDRPDRPARRGEAVPVRGRARLPRGAVRRVAAQPSPPGRTDDDPARWRAFETMPGWVDAVALRRWDDAGKVEGAAVSGPRHLRAAAAVTGVLRVLTPQHLERLGPVAIPAGGDRGRAPPVGAGRGVPAGGGGERARQPGRVARLRARRLVGGLCRRAGGCRGRPVRQRRSEPLADRGQLEQPTALRAGRAGGAAGRRARPHPRCRRVLDAPGLATPRRRPAGAPGAGAACGSSSERTDPAAPIGPVVAGDFNAEPDSSAVRYLSGLAALDGASTYLQDAWRLAGDGGPGITWSNRQPPRRPRPGARPAARLHLQRLPRSAPVGGARSSAAWWPTNRSDGVWPSDHFGVLAVLQS